MPYVKKTMQRQAVKKIVSDKTDKAVGEDDFVSKYIFGIKSLNVGEKSIDSFYSDYIMEKDVSEWSEKDYQFCGRCPVMTMIWISGGEF